MGILISPAWPDASHCSNAHVCGKRSSRFSDSYAQRLSCRCSVCGISTWVVRTARHSPSSSKPRRAARFVVGAQEESDNTVSVRTRDNAQHGVKSIDDMIAEFKRMEEDHVLDLQLGVGPEHAK